MNRGWWEEGSLVKVMSLSSMTWDGGLVSMRGDSDGSGWGGAIINRC